MCVRESITGLTIKGAIELQPDDGPRSSLGIRSGSDDAMRPLREFTWRFAEGIGKFAGNTLGDRRKKTIRLAVRMPKAVGLVGGFGLHPKKIDSGRRYASKRRTQEWT
ncbi:hypothetical protein B296_00025882 [Ensete ventricosum]|uniref:Uncharacterized protein n=1 Tax=Ensete ventricosum TaxID=4639 RepID=A0A426XPZ0_ENSVE|nr:hypothetical protein B296_00025882 [Ensete ventricosum]